MKTQEWTHVDKSAWGPGEWEHEPDKVQWQDEVTGLPCIAVRNAEMGQWCGYVGVSEGHRFFDQHYDAVDVEVHGGLTFSDFCREGDPKESICHIAEPDEPDRVFWLGFDCAHAYDLSPGLVATLRKIGSPWAHHEQDQYRTLDYVKAECAKLAAQLKDTATP